MGTGSANYKAMNTRKASVVHVGGFRPTNELLATNFGLRAAGAPGEDWPSVDGQPMLVVCQLNLTAAPAVPAMLEDIKLITLFADLDAQPLARDNGDNWVLRAYTSLDGLVELKRPAGAPHLHKGFECSWEAADDHPNYDDPARVVPDGYGDSDEDDSLENLARTKIGGYLSTIQSEAWWDQQDHPAKPQYCLQINSEEKVSLMFGDSGTLYLARGTTDGCRGEWFLDWQCF